jgi:hypothetical protein
VGGGIGIANVLTATLPAQAGERFSIHDVVIDDVNAARYHGGGGLFLLLNTWTSNVLNSISINHVTGFADPTGHLLTIGNSISNPTMWGFSFVNNLAYTPVYSVWSAGPPHDCSITDVPLTVVITCFRSYSFSHNVLFSGNFVYPPSKWPSPNYFSSVSGVQFVNYNNGNGGNYHLAPTSPYKNKASDGKDPGADIDAVQAATAGVS